MYTPVIIGTIFVFVGLYFLQGAWLKLSKATASENWPQVQGLITKLVLIKSRLVEGKMQPAEGLVVEYEYEVNHQSYQGKEAAFYTLMYPETYEFAVKYQENKKVSVYYDPAQPETSVLIAGRRPEKPYSDLGLSIVTIVIGAAVAGAAALGWISN